jgi:hypothetical protein
LITKANAIIYVKSPLPPSITPPSPSKGRGAGVRVIFIEGNKIISPFEKGGLRGDLKISGSSKVKCVLINNDRREMISAERYHVSEDIFFP